MHRYTDSILAHLCIQFVEGHMYHLSKLCFPYIDMPLKFNSMFFHWYKHLQCNMLHSRQKFEGNHNSIYSDSIIYHLCIVAQSCNRFVTGLCQLDMNTRDLLHSMHGHYHIGHKFYHSIGSLKDRHIC